ncbi:MAG: Ig-like domain-containing protein, partial [Blastocatellia bacterium]
ITSYYFAAPARDTTTIVGRVLERDRRTPINRALARFRGQEAYTDGNGSYILRYVPVRSVDNISVEVSVVRPSGRVDRIQSASVSPVLGGTTKVPDVAMPATTENRPPTIIAPPRIEAEEGKTTDVRFNVTDPDGNTIRDVRVEGPSFTSVVRGGTGAAIAYFLRLTPNFSHSGGYTLTIRAEDSAGGIGRSVVSLFVKNVNRAPVATNQAVTLDEDTTASIRLEGSDPDGDRLAYTVASQPLSGTLTGSAPNLTYKPNLNFNGVDRFTFKVSDGVVDSNVATVTVTVRPVNDQPILTAPTGQTVNEGQLVSFAVSASDTDVGQRLTIATTGMPTGATLTQATPTSWQFRWTPTFAQAGNYSIGLRVTDDGQPPLSDAKEVRIVVSDVALFTAPGAKTVTEGQDLVFDVTANGGLPSPVVIMATNLPDGATFPGSATNTGQFRWTPSLTQAGSYIISFRATISDLPPVSETAQVTITVLDVERNLAEESASFTVLGSIDASEQQPGSNAGSSVAVGDVNGDGLADLVIGAPSGMAVTNAAAAGSVHIFFGRATLGGTVDLARQPADVNVSGEAVGDLFGSSLAIGDLNGDGQPDLIIGAPGADPTPNAPDGGKVYVVFGDLMPGTPKIAELANLTILGAARGDRLGSSVTVGKINSATGATDLVAGAPFADIPAGADSLVDAGRVYGFWGGALLIGLKDLANSAADFTITGVVANGHLGATLGAGNFNNGDLADIAIGAPNADNGSLKDAGAVYLVLGSLALRGSFSATQLAALVINGADAGDAAGSSLTMGDLNNDGRADVIIGSPGADGPNNDRPGAGEVHVVFGMAIVQGRPPILTIFGDATDADGFPDGFGSEVAMGDFTGDGIADLIVGAPGADPVSPTRQPTGAAYVIFGGIGLSTGTFDLMNRAADLKIFGAKSGDRLGSGGLAVGNVSGAAPGDLAIGAPAAAKVGSGAGGAGEVRVLYGVDR